MKTNNKRSIRYYEPGNFLRWHQCIHITGQLVRIDLMTLQPHLKNDNGQPVIDVSRRIIMPLEGFVQSLAVQNNIIKQLIEAGVLKQNLADTAGIVSCNGIDNKQTEQS